VKVVFLPFDKFNPYQSELSRALAGMEVDVVAPDIHPWLPLASSLWRARDAEIIHLHWLSGFLVKRSLCKSILWSVLFWVEAVLVKAAGKKIVWTVHNLLEHERRHATTEIFFLRLLACRLDHLFVHGRHAEAVVIKSLKIKDPTKVSVVPHGHYLDAYPNTVTREEARAALGTAPHVKVFLFLGQIRDYKGCLDLLEAFRDPALADALLIVAGRPQSSRLADELAALGASCCNIRLHLDFVPAHEIQVYMNAADYVVFPFREIFTSGSLMLAMSFGRKVIVPEIPSLAETTAVMDGIVFNPETPGGLLTALLEAKRSNEKGGGEKNLEYARGCGWYKSAAQVCRVYRKLVPRGGMAGAHE
jgi:glycosyltransferase involved in cell wall biosynthesis